MTLVARTLALSNMFLLAVLFSGCLPRQKINAGGEGSAPPPAPSPQTLAEPYKANPQSTPSTVVPRVVVAPIKKVTAENAGPGEVPDDAETFTTDTTGYSTENTAVEGGALDRKGKRLITFKAYLAGGQPYVSVAMDNNPAPFPYGTRLRFPDIETRYGKVIIFMVVDTGSAFKGKGKSRMDICLGNSQADISAYPFLSGHNKHKVWVAGKP